MARRRMIVGPIIQVTQEAIDAATEQERKRRFKSPPLAARCFKHNLPGKITGDFVGEIPCSVHDVCVEVQRGRTSQKVHIRVWHTSLFGGIWESSDPSKCDGKKCAAKQEQDLPVHCLMLDEEEKVRNFVKGGKK